VTKYKGGNCVGLADHLLATIDEEEVRHKFRWIYAERADQQHLALVVINSPGKILRIKSNNFPIFIASTNIAHRIRFAYVCIEFI
jgi:hypothetical protein